MYILIFVFDENARENLGTTKGMEGGRGTGDYFFVMVMAMAMAMLTVTATATMRAMIDRHLLHDSSEMIVAIIYISFHVR